MADNDQHLKHGKALCGKVFGRFVETFNALVDFMLGIKGDADNKNGEGHITYDRKNNIIRCEGCGGGGGGGDTYGHGRYAIVSIENAVVTMKDTYFNVGGKTRHGTANTVELDPTAPENFIALSISADYEANDSLVVFNSFQDLVNAQANVEYYTIPLFLINADIGDGTIDIENVFSFGIDFRIGPDAAMGEPEQ